MIIGLHSVTALVFLEFIIKEGTLSFILLVMAFDKEPLVIGGNVISLFFFTPFPSSKMSHEAFLQVRYLPILCLLCLIRSYDTISPLFLKF